MADYKELIRKAIEALPENNGAARRAVYEKARAALVGQLRGLNPPLAARDITQHRLQLEDCIRQVEQEASEAVIAGLKQNEDNAPGNSAALPPPRQSSRPPAAQRSLASPPGARANGAAAPASRSTASPAPRPSTISASPRQAPAAPPAGGQRALPSRSTPPAPPRSAPAAASRPTPAPVPRIAAVQPAAPAPASSTRPPAGRSAAIVRANPAVFPRAVPMREPEPEPEYELEEEEPDTIEDIIAAAEDGQGDFDPIEEVDDADIDPDPVEELPPPPAFTLEPRRPRRAAPTAELEEPRRSRAEPRIEPRQEPKAETRALPAIVARAEAAKSGRSARPAESGRRTNGRDTRHEDAPLPLPRQANGRQQNLEPIQLPRQGSGNTAMSRVREVDLEGPEPGDPQVAIERAIATLEREARQDSETDEGAYEEEPRQSRPASGRRRGRSESGGREQAADAAFARGPVESERSGGSAVTIFLLVFLVLLIAVGGGGVWAWREGYIDFDAMFGRSPTTQQAAATATTSPSVAATSSTPAPQTNTEPAPSTASQSNPALSAAPADTPVASTPVPQAAPPAAAAEPSAQAGGAPKSEERLTQTTDSAPAPAVADAGKPGDAAASGGGNQSLLLEASQDGTTGAVPFSGTVDWTKGTDEMGQPTLIGKASIPARNLGVNVLIRKNSDPTLPASHLMEINFSVTDSFIGGAISGLPGVLLKNEELVQGTPLVGASARVVGNSFLFALSSSPADEQTNKDLLTSKKWMDLAIIYATGKKAIITLEKDDKTQQMFNDVFAAWGKDAATPAPAAAPAAPKG